ncbi:MAG TPA: hypothetical protein VND19_01780 [Acetobacteraceae bacterium]|nr:hypothetical protein [Acetobacteraceae bacterium]
MAASRPNIPRGPNIVRGIVRVALGRPDGIGQFSGTPQGFLASLAPLIAFPLVGTFLLLLNGGGESAIADLLATVAVLLAPPVLSFELARLWGQQARWLRFATAFNWCQWLLPVLAAMLMTALGGLLELGLSDGSAMALLVLGLGGYGLWLHWFLARHALALSPFRAVLLVAGVNLGTALLVLVPRLLALQRP